MLERRDFLETLLAGGAGALLLSELAQTRTLASAMIGASQADGPWEIFYPQILNRIQAPVFPRRDFDVTIFGAAGDGKADCTNAFRRSIEACNKAGGGRVIVPAGDFSSGAIHLKSNVNLHVTKGATVRFTRDTSKYPLVLTRFEGMELMNFSPFVYAFEQQHIAITGEGTLDGNADADH